MADYRGVCLSVASSGPFRQSSSFTRRHARRPFDRRDVVRAIRRKQARFIARERTRWFSCITSSIHYAVFVIRCGDWWTHIVLETFSRRDWIENFRMSQETFQYVCEQLKPSIRRSKTRLRGTISVEMRVAVTL